MVLEYYKNVLDGITGESVSSWYHDLKKDEEGCWSACFGTSGANAFYIVMGWHHVNGKWHIAWKIGRQDVNNIMQSDFDVDFKDVSLYMKGDDRLEYRPEVIVENEDNGYIDADVYCGLYTVSKRYGSWNGVAKTMVNKIVYFCHNFDS